MKRVMVIGCCGAGKSTFSKRLQTFLNIDLIHLDQYYWKPNWEEPDVIEWKRLVNGLAVRPRWIMDGNYSGTMDLRIKRADTIIYLDFSTLHCLWRITTRTLKYWRRERPDMPLGCKERFNLPFFYYVAMFNFTRRKKLLQRLKSVEKEKKIWILTNTKEITFFFKSLKVHTELK